jgi:hypothetical protein
MGISLLVIGVAGVGVVVAAAVVVVVVIVSQNKRPDEPGNE